MAAILQPAWLAISLFAVQVSAFVPFGRVHVPHVKVRPAVSVAPGGRGHSARGWAGAPAAQRQRRVRLPLMMSPATAERVLDPMAWLVYDPELAKSPVPPRVPFSASAIVDGWLADAREEMESSSRRNTASRMQSLADYRASLQRFKEVVTPGGVLALTAKWYGGKNIIQALAVVTPVVLRDDTGQLAALAGQQGLGARWGEGFQAVNIAVIVGSPEDKQDGVRDEFIRRVVTWARVTGFLVTLQVAAGGEAERAYGDRGFVRVEGDSAYMAYTGHGLGSLGNADRFQMFIFDV